METLKRTVLFHEHLRLKANMVDFGGWEMPVNYPAGISEEHLYTRQKAGIFDISHMARFVITGKEAVKFLQHVLTSNVLALDLNQAQYTIIPNENGGALDDAYLYRFYEDQYLLVVNAANAEKDWAHLTEVIKTFDAQITNQSDALAMIAIQGPDSKNILAELSGDAYLTEPVKNALNIVALDGKEVRIAKTGYTGEPIGFELFVKSEEAVAIWNLLIEKGAAPAGLGARDTLRMEAGYPLYGHELGLDIDGKEIPIYSVPLAKFAVSFSEAKGDYIGKKALLKQFEVLQRIIKRDFSDISDLPRMIKPIALIGKGIARNGCKVYKDGVEVGYVTSGTMAPYFKTEGQGLDTIIKEEKGMRSIGLALVNSDVLVNDEVEVEIRGKKAKAAITPYHLRGDAPPFARPILHGFEEIYKVDTPSDYKTKALNLIEKSLENHMWRQEECINLIPSEQSHSSAVRLLSIMDPSFRYAEHKKIKSFYDYDVFYYQGTKFIDEVEHLLVEELKKYFNCTEVETRVISGQMANTAVFSALMDYKNRVNRKREASRLGYVLNNHIIKGGHLSAQPMGALHDYIAIDPVTEKSAVVNFPVLKDNNFKIDVEETKKVIDKFKPELIIFGKSMVLHKEPVKEIREFVDEQKINTTIMYDMAHVLGLAGDYFQNPFAEGAEIVTGSTHKTFFGTQRGIIAGNYQKEDFKYEFWETIERRAFPGSVSNHHLGTMLGLLMAAYEMNYFKDAYQKNIIENAKHFAKALKEAGLEVVGDPAISYTETHQVMVNVGYGTGPEVANRLEDNNIIVNYQATPEEEGFTASGALRIGVSEMVRFGFDKKEFEQLAEIIADVVLRNKNVREDVKKLRSNFTSMKYCFTDEEIVEGLNKLAKGIHL
ncbi:glycine cleavage system aminomethyltransferase GcvT [Clostridium formicaceticum]|uniref:Aminomethyltransferase n=1 Tax=Clostridium formicaceticum TaxID=1497 RepID=A0AAC9RN25_9CLOT|nr:glycine cleavage system aminomethyltransferase GcvT [Clostridium formicaceticum]AOY78053.1 glycine cleavage system protein T [Clostridium formicaceticum]ARE88689.1 Aminomethyltransferase [Clostridium formicaceticum]